MLGELLEKQPEPEAQAQTINAASRLSARSALLEQATRLEREAAGLRRLAGVLPGEMPQEAEEALWELVVSRR